MLAGIVLVEYAIHCLNVEYKFVYIFLLTVCIFAGIPFSRPVATSKTCFMRPDKGLPRHLDLLKC